LILIRIEVIHTFIAFLLYCAQLAVIEKGRTFFACSIIVKISNCAVETISGIRTVLAAFHNTRTRPTFALIQIIIIVTRTLDTLIRTDAVLAKSILLITTFTKAIVDIKLIYTRIAYEITKAATTTS
jgi:hypothetical protein